MPDCAPASKGRWTRCQEGLRHAGCPLGNALSSKFSKPGRGHLQEQAEGLANLDAALRQLQATAAAQQAEAGRLKAALAAAERRCEALGGERDGAVRATQAAQVRLHQSLTFNLHPKNPKPR